MRKVIFTETKKIDVATTFEKTVESPDDKETTLVIDLANINSERNKSDHYYIPAILAQEAEENISVYFDLELYPFFQVAKESKQSDKGVLRLRRTAAGEVNEGLIAEDLFVLSALFGGDPGRINVTSSSSRYSLRHIVILADFGEGKMAHLEYTFGYQKEKIELEWSGIGEILEFNSEEMAPFDPIRYSILPLSYSVDSIISHAKKLDGELVERLQMFREIVKGGTEN